jgi:hypothetical protein
MAFCIDHLEMIANFIQANYRKSKEVHRFYFLASFSAENNLCIVNDRLNNFAGSRSILSLSLIYKKINIFEMKKFPILFESDNVFLL